jgi:hypothetical protein
MAMLCDLCAVLELIKTAQTQNGLRHNDFDRYAQYCTRRLSRIRHAGSVDFTYGKGKAFVPKTLTAEQVTDVRHLQIPLMNAERAWAMSQKYQQDISDGSGLAKDRYHPIQRLRKAVKWANLLESLTAERGDARAELETQAYAAWMRSSLAIDSEDWSTAMTNIITAKRIYEELANAASRRQKELYVGRLEELAPMERFAKYNVDRSGGKASEVSNVALGDKIAAALAESKEGGTSTDGSSIFWRCAHYSLRNPKLRQSLAAATDKGRQFVSESKLAESSSGESAVSKTELLYLEVLSRYDAAVKLASVDSARAAKEGKADVASDCQAIEQHIKFGKLRHTLDRNTTLIKDAVLALQALITGQETAAAGAGKDSARKGRNKQSKSAPLPAPKPAASSFFSNPWLSTLAGVSTQQSLAVGTSGVSVLGTSVEGANPLAATAAHGIATWYARSLRTLDEMIVLAGGVPPADNPVTSSFVKVDASLAVDEPLVAALLARRQVVMAWRAYFMAVASIYTKNYSDATVLMHRAQERAYSAMDMLKALPSGLKAKDLPAEPLAPGQEDSSLHVAAVLSGISAQDALSVRNLLDRISQQTVALQATALLEQLAPRLKLDGSFGDAYVSTFMPAASAKHPAPASLRRSDRPTVLLERVDPCCAIEASLNPGVTGAWPPQPQPVPFKPLLLDLAFNYFDYPDLKSRVPEVYKTARPEDGASGASGPPGKTSAAPATGGLFGWLGR